MNRIEFLDKVKDIVGKERTGHYGEPEQSFKAIAGHWDLYIKRLNGRILTEFDVCMMMSLLKIVRAQSTPEYFDSLFDLAGYAACGAEVVKAFDPTEKKELPDTDGWIEWKRGDCPVDEYCRVDLQWGGGKVTKNMRAGDLFWGELTNIIAYRLTNPKKAAPAMYVGLEDDTDV